ncbi:uncharacterized protein F5891DRAFT_1034835 [Suillus fuscotomentosus]|uniref:Secreted protein n=1 Tax=Suillus fuscotomentosus TaxID=1912939 RepID=A0AAD4E5S5_9AGAM|nr:uncharacterized protein F5891DRAFT_1034835 [Suillus fuscotomentosus]KAG1900250.1 hypothetical protein F5891DRAFT_1034835 [Suillus fuscotomentosus]
MSLSFLSSSALVICIPLRTCQHSSDTRCICSAQGPASLMTVIFRSLNIGGLSCIEDQGSKISTRLIHATHCLDTWLANCVGDIIASSNISQVLS